jgi:hypothetical protein
MSDIGALLKTGEASVRDFAQIFGTQNNFQNYTKWPTIFNGDSTITTPSSIAFFITPRRS